jgi:formylglycine-generating enzyme required for sulfatase activity
MAKKTSKKVVKKPGTKAPRKEAESSAPAAALATPEIKKIRGLLKSKTTDGVTLGLSLLESLGATQADYEAVFTESVIKSILGGWVAESWGAVAKALVPHGTVSDVFQRLAEEKYLKRPRRLADFSGLIHARAPAFLAAWGQGSAAKKPFLDLVDIKSGSFTMGSPANEADRSHDENQVQVRITKPFRMGRTVVTQRQWREVLGTEPWRDDRIEKGDDFPAVYVSWDDAVLFCQTLTDLERETGRLTATQSYRLPTEAEWEYACRAGTVSAYSFGDNPNLLDEHGWHLHNSGGGCQPRLHEVAEKKPNPWGLFDMHGNVYEWCADWYDATLVGGDDPVGPAVTTSFHVLRGGVWCHSASHCRSASRNAKYGPPWSGDHSIGFRVVVVEPSESSVTPDDGSAPGDGAANAGR